MSDFSRTALAGALDLAARGFRVHPLDGKRPRVKDWPNQASADPAVISEWWRRWPSAGVGVRCGELGDGRYLVVLDVDGKKGADALHELECHHGELPATVRSTTPRGRHYWFFSAGPTPNSASKLGAGLDMRGQGGYVAVPPAAGREWDVSVEDRELAELPHWIVQRLQRPVGVASRPPAAWAELAANGVPEGERNDFTARYAGRLLRKGLDPAEVVELLVKLGDPPLDRREVERTVESIARHEAAKRADQGVGLNDEDIYAGRVLDVEGLLAEPDTPIPWRCDRLAADGYLTVIAGRGGEGKSWMTLALACGVARGEAVAGIPCAPGKALIFDAENGRDQIRRRLRAAGVTPSLAVQPVEAGGLNITRNRDLAWIRETIEQHGARLVVLDSLRVLSSGVKEDDSGAMEPVITRLKLVARETGAAVILVHHRGRSESSDFRGSSVILDQTDLLFTIARSKGDPQGHWRRSIKAVKCRIDEEAAPRWVAIEADRRRKRVAIVEAEPFDAEPATPARTSLRNNILDQLTADPQPTARIAMSLGRAKNDGTVRRTLSDLEAAGEAERRDDGGWGLPTVDPLGRGNPGNPPENGVLESNPGLPEKVATGAHSQPSSSPEQVPQKAPRHGQNGWSAEAADAFIRCAHEVFLGSVEIDANGQPVAADQNDLSDLGPEQPLADPASRPLAPEPCRCDRPQPDGERGCFRCGRTLEGAP